MQQTLTPYQSLYYAWLLTRRAATYLWLPSKIVPVSSSRFAAEPTAYNGSPGKTRGIRERSNRLVPPVALHSSLRRRNTAVPASPASSSAAEAGSGTA